MLWMTTTSISLYMLAWSHTTDTACNREMEPGKTSLPSGAAALPLLRSLTDDTTGSWPCPRMRTIPRHFLCGRVHSVVLQPSQGPAYSRRTLAGLVLHPRMCIRHRQSVL